MDARSPDAPPHATETASQMLESLLEALPNERATAGELVDALEARAHGFILLILSLPMCIPNVPGISTIFGFLMLAPALALVFGQRRIWLPREARSWTFPREGLRRAVRATAPALRRAEFLIRPRLSFLTRFPVTILVGLQTLLMAIILILPIPFANWPPGMTVAMTSLALLQRDGLLMLLTIPAAMASVGSVYFGARVGAAVLHSLAIWLHGLVQGLF
jgi:hypothetical protein